MKCFQKAERRAHVFKNLGSEQFTNEEREEFSKECVPYNMSSDSEEEVEPGKKEKVTRPLPWRHKKMEVAFLKADEIYYYSKPPHHRVKPSRRLESPSTRPPPAK